MPRVRIPTPLRALSGGASEVEVDGSTVVEVLKALDAAYPGFQQRLYDDEGNLRRFVNVFVADEDIRFLSGLDTPVDAGETVSIIPAVAGGVDTLDQDGNNGCGNDDDFEDVGPDRCAPDPRGHARRTERARWGG